MKEYSKWGILFIIVFLVSLFAKNNQFLENLLFLILINATLASSWNIIGGYCGQFSLCNGLFYGLGMYSSALLFIKFDISPWIGIIIATILVAIVALAIGSLVFWRLKARFFALATLAFVEIGYRICIYLDGLTRGSEGLPIPNIGGPKNMIFNDKFYYVIIMLVICFITIMISGFIKSRKLGYQLIALREDEQAAESLGINTYKCKIIAFMLSAVFCAMAGAVYVQYTTFIDPNYAFSVDVSIKMALMTMIGGVSTVAGPFIGAFIMVFLEVFTRTIFAGGNMGGVDILIDGILLMIIVIYLPGGFLKCFKLSKKEIYKKKKAKAHVLSNDRKINFESDKAFSFFNNQKENIKIPSNILGDYYKKIKDRNKAIKGQIIFRVSNLTKRFGGLVAVNNLSFEVRKGDILGIIGPNGAGKTTLYNLITGFYPIDEGKIEFKGKVISGLNSPNVICRIYNISRTFQVVKPFANMTVLENIMVGALCRENNIENAQKKAQEIIKFIGIKKYSNVPAHSLPIALKKRVELGRSIATEPELLLLDESMAGLTPEETKELIDLIRKISLDTTVIIIEHVMKAIMALSKRIIVLDHGEKIAEGTPKEISQNEKVIEVYMGKTGF